MNRRKLSARSRPMNARRSRVTVLPAPTGVITEWDVPVPIRDGTILRVNVFRLEGAGPTSPCGRSLAEKWRSKAPCAMHSIATRRPCPHPFLPAIESSTDTGLGSPYMR